MAAKKDTKFVKVIISERVDNKEYMDEPKARYVRQGGVIVENGRFIAKDLLIKLDTEVEIPENFVEYIKARKEFKTTTKGDSRELVRIYNVEKV